MDTGFYVNLYQVFLPDTPVPLMRVERTKYPDLRKLRRDLADKNLPCQVYASREDIYGYGEQSAEGLIEYGFVQDIVHLHSIPEVVSRMVLEGLVNQLIAEGYDPRWKKGRVSIFDYTTPVVSLTGGARLYKGYDLRTLFLKDPGSETLLFGVIVDIVYAYTDNRRVPLNTHDLTARFGNNALLLFRQKQGELLPNRRINLEVSRQRFTEDIAPFVQQHSSFDLPCGVEVTLAAHPVRIVLSGEESRL